MKSVKRQPFSSVARVRKLRVFDCGSALYGSPFDGLDTSVIYNVYMNGRALFRNNMSRVVLASQTRMTSDARRVCGWAK